MTKRILEDLIAKDKVFKPELIGIVNPNLLERLWLKQRSKKALVYESKFGFTLVKKMTVFGVYQEILSPYFS